MKEGEEGKPREKDGKKGKKKEERKQRVMEGKKRDFFINFCLIHMNNKLI